MANKIRLVVGWFGILFPIYAAGGLTVLWLSGIPGEVVIPLTVQVVVACIVLLIFGRLVLRVKLTEKGDK